MHCINVKLVEVCDQIASSLSPRYYLSTDAIIWDYSGGDTFCRMCEDCGFYRPMSFLMPILKCLKANIAAESKLIRLDTAQTQNVHKIVNENYLSWSRRSSASTEPGSRKFQRRHSQADAGCQAEQ